MKSRYAVRLRHSDYDVDSEYWIADVPALPGCKADGKTEEECMKAIKEVAELWIEVARESGREIPDGEIGYSGHGGVEKWVDDWVEVEIEE